MLLSTSLRIFSCGVACPSCVVGSFNSFVSGCTATANGRNWSRKTGVSLRKNGVTSRNDGPSARAVGSRLVVAAVSVRPSLSTFDSARLLFVNVDGNRSMLRCRLAVWFAKWRKVAELPRTKRTMSRSRAPSSVASCDTLPTRRFSSTRRRATSREAFATWRDNGSNSRNTPARRRERSADGRFAGGP